MDTKQTIIEEVAARTGYKESYVKTMFNTLIDVIKQKIKSGVKIRIVGFGTFYKATSNRKTATNFDDKSRISIGPKRRIAFTGSKQFNKEL